MMVVVYNGAMQQTQAAGAAFAAAGVPDMQAEVTSAVHNVSSSVTLLS